MALQNYPRIGALTFLVVDDSVIMRRLIKRALSELGVTRIVEAGNSNAAWSALTVGGVDFILCDWNMPGGTGIDFLSRVREDPTFSALPFLMISAESKTENIMQAIRNGVSNYLTKPFTTEILARKIIAILDQTCPGWDSERSAAAPSDTGS
jgi:two-component system chemotaxis response regulator CheY